MEGDDLDFPENETVKVPCTAMAFRDATFGYSMSTSFFPYLPSA